jgi:hypothetical protein
VTRRDDSPALLAGRFLQILRDRLPLRRGWLRIGALAAAMLLIRLGAPAPAFAFDGAASPPTGLDISWPECASGIPSSVSGQSLTIIGVTGGKAFTRNPCFAHEYLWSTAQGSVPSFYINLNYPSRADASRGQTGPRGTCGANDVTCHAYNYGYNAAQEAALYARSANATAPAWWLDVETTNHWSSDTGLNATVILGSIDYFRTRGLAVGIYSVTPMWREIAGNSTFGLPIWVAQTSVTVPTMAYCSSNYAFAGGTTAMVQSWNGRYDVDYGCPVVNVSRSGASPLAPLSLNGEARGVLAASEGGTAIYYTFPNSRTGSQQTVTLTFWPHGPDLATGLFITLYQNSSQLQQVRAINATTPGTVTLSFSSRSSSPFVIQLMNYNVSSAAPVSYTLSPAYS